jgi:serine protease
MKSLMLAVVASFLVVATGCQVTTYTSSSYGQPVGGSCSDDGDCAGSAVCGSNYPGGYCFLSCTGHSSICPSGSMCVSLTGSSSSQCFQSCSTSGECRSGYTCAPVSGSSQGICLPR